MLNAPIGGSSGLAIFVDTANVNVASMLLANGWDGTSVVHPIVFIGQAARVYSNSLSLPAFDTGSLPAGSTCTINNSGAILGKGGTGGASARPGGLPGTSGGTGIKLRVPTTITNNGVIAGGGGGGGSGGSGSIADPPGARDTDGGSGGGGAGNGKAGAKLPYSNQGADGNLSSPGAGGAGYGNGGAGGNGGFYGQAGGNGGNGYDVVSGATRIGGAGGASGAAVDGDSLVTWSVLGTIYGPRIG